MSLDMEEYTDELLERAELVRKFGAAILEAKTPEERAEIIKDKQARSNAADYSDLAYTK